MGHLTTVSVTSNQFIEKGDPIGEIDPSVDVENITGYNENNLPQYQQGSGAIVVAGTEAPHVCFGIFGENGLDGRADGGWGWFNPLSFLPVTNEAYPWMSP